MEATCSCLREKNILTGSQILPSWDLTPRQKNNVEMLLVEAFSPLKGFLNQADYESVLSEKRLRSGELWPLPITLDVPSFFADRVSEGTKIELRDAEGVLIALMTIESIWMPDKQREAEFIFGTTDSSHPEVNHLLSFSGDTYLGGELEKVELPTHYDYPKYRHTPAELKQEFKKLGWQHVLAYHTHQIIHKLEQYELSYLAKELNANLLIHAAIGECFSSSFDYFHRVRCYTSLLKEFSLLTPFFSLLNLNIQNAGFREVLCHALIRKNYGCTHFIVDGRSNDSFSDSYFLQMKKYESEIGLKIVKLEKHVYLPECKEYVLVNSVPSGQKTLTFSHGDLLQNLQENLPIPSWYSYPAIINEVCNVYPPRHKQGFTVFFTGLSGSGKSTIANVLRIKLLERESRSVTLLDGDIVRKVLSSELNFSKRHRDLNILRIGYVANEITKNGGIAICAPIAPYKIIRQQVRKTIETVGGYIEIYVATPIEECERRDRKGLYAKARAGLIENFTGVNDPYEPPENPTVQIDNTHITSTDCVNQIILKLEEMSFLER
jgi:sulfate adenylyltransferase